MTEIWRRKIEMARRWMETEIDAKVFVELKPEQIPDVVMALDDLRKKATAGEKQVGLAISYRAMKDALTRQNPDIIPDEHTVMENMQYVQVARKKRRGKYVIPKTVSREVVVANTIQRLTEDSDVLGDMITDRQVPKSVIEQRADEGELETITRENLASCLQYLVRPEPVKNFEMSEGSDPREMEYQNVQRALEILADKVIIPLAQRDLNQAISICRRHPLEAVGRTLNAIFTQIYSLDSSAPLFGHEIKDWTKYTEYVKRLKDINWADPTFQGLRSASDMFDGMNEPGLPDVVRKGVKRYVFPSLP